MCLCCILVALLLVTILLSGCFCSCANVCFLYALPLVLVFALLLYLVFVLLSGYFAFCVMVALCCVLIALFLVRVLHSGCFAPCVNDAILLIAFLRLCC